MTNEIIIDDIRMIPLPADADATALMLNLIESAINEIRDCLPYYRDRFDIISDYDDYIPAASRILNATLDRFLAHIDQTPRDALLALLSDSEFINDLMTCDFSSDLHSAIQIDYCD